jgi:hypothetical protein
MPVATRRSLLPLHTFRGRSKLTDHRRHTGGQQPAIRRYSTSSFALSLAVSKETSGLLCSSTTKHARWTLRSTLHAFPERWRSAEVPRQSHDNSPANLSHSSNPTVAGHRLKGLPVTGPACAQPWHSPNGNIYAAVEALHTTATVMHALMLCIR